jgi:hypothetical protein
MHGVIIHPINAPDVRFITQFLSCNLVWKSIKDEFNVGVVNTIKKCTERIMRIGASACRMTSLQTSLKLNISNGKEFNYSCYYLYLYI